MENLRTIVETLEFIRWLEGLKDLRAAARITYRIDMLAAGHHGQFRPLGGGVNELKIDYGPGYRIYYMERNREIVILLFGGDKSSQDADIKRAKDLAVSIKAEGS